MTHNLGQTTNFTLDLPDADQADSNSSDGKDHGWSGLTTAQRTAVTNHANFLLSTVAPSTKSVIETAFDTTTGWFGIAPTKFGTGNRQELAFDLPNNSGAYNPATGTLSTSTRGRMTPAPLGIRKRGCSGWPSGLKY
jgi:hypothetical protein